MNAIEFQVVAHDRVLDVQPEHRRLLDGKTESEIDQCPHDRSKLNGFPRDDRLAVLIAMV